MWVSAVNFGQYGHALAGKNTKGDEVQASFVLDHEKGEEVAPTDCKVALGQAVDLFASLCSVPLQSIAYGGLREKGSFCSTVEHCA